MEKVCADCVSGWSIARGPAPGAGGFGAASPGRYTAADLAGLVVARRQLWLLQARVPDADKAALLDAPISLGHTFGPAVEEILQKSLRDREASRQVAALLPPCAPAWNRSSRWRAPRTQTVTRTVPVPTAPRHRLQGNRAQPAGGTITTWKKCVLTAYLDGVLREAPLPEPVASELRLLADTLLQSWRA
ncbi:UNVERIFIED_CONTAM: hypothetical protein FKN15_000425 [Acipenser sinensis]